MIELRLSRPEEAGAQKELWKEAFGDADEDIGLFYDRCWRPTELLVLLENGRLASMAALLPHTLSGPDGRTASAGYVYALATARAVRGRGYARLLLNRADELLRERGAACATVVPAQPGLHRFFEGAGFQPCFSTWRTQVPCGAVPAPEPGDALRETAPEEYGTLRARCLEGIAAAHYPVRLLEFQQGMCRLSGGGLYRLEVGGAVGCAAAEYRGGTLVLKELLLPPKAASRGLALVAGALPAEDYEVRGPVGCRGLPGGGRWEFGRIKWYDLDRQARFGKEGYFGLGFD